MSDIEVRNHINELVVLLERKDEEAKNYAEAIEIVAQKFGFNRSALAKTVAAYKENKLDKAISAADEFLSIAQAVIPEAEVL